MWYCTAYIKENNPLKCYKQRWYQYYDGGTWVIRKKDFTGMKLLRLVENRNIEY
jgi:hypothetical protein